MANAARPEATETPTHAQLNDAGAVSVSNQVQDLMKHTRPDAPHYIGQDKYDVSKGILDLDSGKFHQGENEIHSGIKDLDNEQKLINKAIGQGGSAAKDIATGNDKQAEKDLQSAIDGIGKNYYNGDAKKEYTAAEKALQSGNKQEASSDILKAEHMLQQHRQTVNTARGDLQTGLKDFNSGKFSEGMKDFQDSLSEFIKPHPTPVSVPPNQAA